MDNNKGEIILYQTEDGQTKLEVQLKNETVWLSIDQMAELFQRDRTTILRHVNKIIADGELAQDATCVFFCTSSESTPYTIFHYLKSISSISLKRNRRD